MRQQVEAIFEGGKLRLLTPLLLREQQHVFLTITESESTLETEQKLEPVPSPQAKNELTAEDRPWRDAGFVGEFPRTELFIHWLDVRTADLPCWQPQINVLPRWLRDE